jgi:hypothetical protein
MNDRYRPNGKPLTEREREILTVLIEECGEVIQSATKDLTDAVVERQAAERKHDRMRWYMQTSADITHARIR